MNLLSTWGKIGDKGGCLADYPHVFVKLLFCLSLVPLVIGCAYDSSRPLSEAQVLLARATVERQETVNTINDQGTRQAIASNEQSTRESFNLQQTRVRQTEISQQNRWTSTAIVGQTRSLETQVARRETRQAQEQTTQLAQERQTATVRSQERQTAQAQEKQTATAVAHYPTATAEAILAQAEFTKLQRQQELESLRYEYEKRALGIRVFLETLTPPVLAIITIGLCAYAFYLLLASLERRSRMNSVQVIKDLAGEPKGYLSSADIQFHPFEVKVIEQPMMSEPTAPILLTDGQDYKQLSFPDPLINGMIHRTDLKIFIETILARCDWTQGFWRDKKLPRGFVMSNDTKDANGIIVYGGYSKLMQMLVEYHLIIDRRKGKTGRWNPNAPDTVETVMQILGNELTKPELPQTQTEPNPIYGNNIPVAA